MSDIRSSVSAIIHDKMLNQSLVAKAIGLSPQQLSAIVNLRRELKATEFLDFCELVDMLPTEVRDYLNNRSEPA